jgi:uncharacterized protein
MPTIVDPDDRLPLTCTRSGTCCHGKEVWLNPWDLSELARAHGITVHDCRRRFTVDGGIRLRFDGPAGWKDLPACSQYDAALGCRVHAHRPLPCRLYPLGRQRRRDRVEYLHDGAAFPCLEGCPGVQSLPSLTVREYLAGQRIDDGAAAADGYLELAQDLAEGAFVLVFDSGLAASGCVGLLARWRQLAGRDARARAEEIPPTWLDRLQVPDLDHGEGRVFVAEHGAALQAACQSGFSTLSDPRELADASVVMLAMALHLSQSIGGDAGEFGRVWCGTAEANGMR